MERSSRNPSKNVLRRIYAFALGAAISTVGFSMYRATTPGVQEPEIRTLSMNEAGTVSIEELEEAVWNPEVKPLAELAMFQPPELIGDTFFTNKESQEKEECLPEELLGGILCHEEMVEDVERGVVAVTSSMEDTLNELSEVAEEEVEDVEIPSTVVASAAPKTNTERMELPQDHGTNVVTKVATVPVEAPVVEEAIVVNEAIVNEVIAETPVENITESIVTENITEGVPMEVLESPVIVDESIVIDEAIAVEITPHVEYGNWGPDSPLFSPSGLSVEHIAKVLDGTEMDGLEQVVYDTEQTYGINACILLAIACNESGYGASRMAHRQNNLFGMMGMKFSSLEENIDYFGRLMVKYRDEWHKTMTANGICRAYVGQNENTAGWPKKITGIMNSIYAKATK